MIDKIATRKPADRSHPESAETQTAENDPEFLAVQSNADVRTARRSRVASLVLVLVLLGVALFAVWSSQSTSSAARSADVASKLSDYYDQADRAVSAEESLERKYRLEPGPGVRAEYDAASADLMNALDLVARNGDQGDREQASRVNAAHHDYRSSISRLFDAVDKGDTPLALKIDSNEVDPKFFAIAEAVHSADVSHHEASLSQLTQLRHLEELQGWLTPWVFLLGLLLALATASVTRGHRRLLDAERRRALHRSLHDALTGLPNRTLLFERCRQALSAAQHAGTTAGLLLIDMDRFKEINDTFGHHYGDELLKQVGARLRSVLTGGDTIARLGGDEFAVLLPDVTDVLAATDVGARLRDALETPFLIDGVALDVEASVGVVLSGEHGTDPTTLLQRADVAMYVAKAQNLGVFAYDADADGHSPAKLALLGDLRRALTANQLVLDYQPKISLGDGEIIGAEALVRWQHPERGLIFPDGFIPLAEHTGLIGPLTGHVLDSALAQARAWMDDGRPLPLSVNLSARSLLDDSLPEHVADLLALHRVPAEMLELEITESALMAEPARAQRLLETLALMGVRLSIDDFGAGYTSLGQLKNLPVTEIKIDKSFILNMTTQPSDALIVRSVIDLGHSLGLTVLAEGVETAEILSHLMTFDCDVAQGHYFSRPVPAAAFDAWRASYSAGTTVSREELWPADEPVDGMGGIPT
ncbi:putative bifunctional diguanylate cyclase/phosphodiesterase [Arthrobacter sp. MMS18-M83]|uniref:putative bifunctional diguanylate cyclase/phosphodiesterase n=1 Tax=Arthrobacter sp. MMS18-M83 TaxID=2996261 RepID=UPI00227C9262|nr:EAL domain-containing protein [Arthrobacter sp. MMS18-M83]WAH97232.1 EAL domain-containing protein [Arthrobacter sp. MMS18-M83]